MRRIIYDPNQAKRSLALASLAVAALLAGCDRDGDGYRSGVDCDDQNASAFPGGGEVCDGLDNDCDGTADDVDLARRPTFVDSDGDGVPGTRLDRCPVPGTTVYSTGPDCDDADSAVSPDAEEVCDGVDNNCNGFVDTDTLASVRFVDADGDGEAPIRFAEPTCATGPGTATALTDCDDADARAWSEAIEVCDGADNDCDGVIDEDGVCP